jgi:hypothetical protein
MTVPMTAQLLNFLALSFLVAILLLRHQNKLWLAIACHRLILPIRVLLMLTKGPGPASLLIQVALIRLLLLLLLLRKGPIELVLMEQWGQAVSGDPLAQKIPEQFQFSKEKTAAAALNMFAKDELDLNGDGFVNKVELSRKHDELEEAAKKNPKSKEILEKQQAVNYMIMDYSKLSSAHDDEFFSESSGITIYDLASTVSSVNKAKR